MPAPERPVVMVVDDTPASIRVLLQALQEDYELVIATRGTQALELALQQPQPDLILLDMMMPEMDGHEVCRRLKSDERTRDIPIIFVTADTSPETERTSFEIGAVDYVTKPFSLPVVKARVRTHVSLKQKTDLLEKLAQLDGLTGIANRRKFDEVLETEWLRCARHRAPLSIIIADIDNFKEFNDKYGHGAGDQCLREVGQLLVALAARSGDLAARYGGEEFVLLLPSTDAAGAQMVADRLREKLEELQKQHPSRWGGSRITMSAGYATTTPEKHRNPTELVTAADEKLYQAKREGRNRTLGVAVS